MKSSRAEEILPTAEPLISMRAEKWIKTWTEILDAFYAKQEWFCGWHQQVPISADGRPSRSGRRCYKELIFSSREVTRFPLWYIRHLSNRAVNMSVCLVLLQVYCLFNNVPTQAVMVDKQITFQSFSHLHRASWCYQIFICPTDAQLDFPKRMSNFTLTHWGRVTQICVFTLQLCKTDHANLCF